MKRLTTEDELDLVITALDTARVFTHKTRTLTEQVSDLLDLLVPEEGNNLATLGQWAHSPDFESAIVEWLERTVETDDHGRSKFRKLFTDGDRQVEVHAFHLLGDYWQVTTFGFVLLEGDVQVPVLPDGIRDPKFAMAVARITGCGGAMS